MTRTNSQYDNHTCSKSIEDLGTWACDLMLLSDRIDDFLGEYNDLPIC